MKCRRTGTYGTKPDSGKGTWGVSAATLITCLAALCGLVTPGDSSVAWAQQYPVNTVTLITHSSAGSGSDIMLRSLAPFIERALGVDTVVRNIRGGSAANAMATLARSPADGSVVYATTPTFIYTSLLSSPEYRYTDILPLVNLFRDPQVIYTSADSPFESLQQVLRASKITRGRWGVSSPASLERQVAEQLARERWESTLQLLPMMAADNS